MLITVFQIFPCLIDIILRFQSLFAELGSTLLLRIVSHAPTRVLRHSVMMCIREHDGVHSFVNEMYQHTAGGAVRSLHGGRAANIQSRTMTSRSGESSWSVVDAVHVLEQRSYYNRSCRGASEACSTHTTDRRLGIIQRCISQDTQTVCHYQYSLALYTISL